MKKLQQPARKEKRSTRNGATRDANGRRERGSSIHGLRHPKSDLESAVQRYVDLYDFAPIAYVSFDRAGRIEEANLAATELLGERRDLLIGRPFAFYVADLDLLLRHLLYCRTSDQRVETELPLKPRKGERIPALLISTPITSTTRNGARLYQTAIMDLRERKQHEQQLTEQARLLDLSNDAIIVRDTDDRITYWNKGAQEMYGYTREEALGKLTYELLQTRFSEPLQKIYKKLDRDNRWEGELVHTRRDGARITVFSRWASERNAQGNRAAVLETNNDITERKRTEEQLELVSRLPEENPAPVIRLQEGHILSFANPAAERLLSHWGKTVGDEAPTRFGRMACAALADGNKRDLEIDSGRRSYAVSVCPVRHANYVNLYFDDITERKHAQNELEKSKGLLEKRVRERTRELGAANIELQNEIVRRKGLEGQILEISDREQEKLGRELHDGLCQQLTAIGFFARATALRLKDHRVVQEDDLEKIAQLINSSVMDARNIARDLHKEDIDAAQFVPALRNMVERKIWKTPCRLELKTKIDIEDDTVASQLYRILREAIINANKHAQATNILLEIRRSRNELVFSVIDDGVGFNTKTKTGGGGLGFHIMKYRAESIGARVEFESRKKRGARVAVYLPLAMKK